MPARDEIYARVANVLVRALGVEEDDLKPSATLQGDLGAESIDFLDVVFRLERGFRIRIPRGELFPEPVSPDDRAFSREGRVTLKAFADHGGVGPVLPADGGDCEDVLARFAEAGIDIDALAARLQDEGTTSFVKSWDDLMGVVASRCAALNNRQEAKGPRV